MNRVDPSRIAQLTGSERVMHRVLNLEPDFYYGGVHLFYGVFYGSRAPMLGGNFDQSYKNFARARAVTDGKLLIVDVLQAEYLERQRMNQNAFHDLLISVVDTPVGSFPEMALANQIARVRARHLLGLEEQWF